MKAKLSNFVCFRILSVFLVGVAIVSTTLFGCSDSSAERQTDFPQEVEVTEEADSYIDSDLESNRVDCGISEDLDGLMAAVEEEIDARANGSSEHYSVGEEVVVTNNLAVTVVSIQSGPFDFGDGNPTVQVNVTMRNLSNKPIRVKASNWDADNSYGQRVDHKLAVKNEDGSVLCKSFSPTRISPNASFSGTLYFDGESLTTVLYEPHWLISSESQYAYFDV